MKLLINKKFIHSTVLLAVGVLMTVGSMTNPGSTSAADSLPGLCVILGALAYRSAKQRRLQLVENTKKRKLLEFLALISIAVLILTGPDILQLIRDGDILTLGILVWAIFAYLCATSRRAAERKNATE